MKQAAARIRLSVVSAAVVAVACGCSVPKPLDPELGNKPAAIAETSALTAANFEKIKSGTSPAEVDSLLGLGRDAPSPPAFYRQAAAAEIEQEFGVKRWREWWSSSTGVAITFGFNSSDKALVKQFDDGSRVQFVGWKDGLEIVPTAG